MAEDASLDDFLDAGSGEQTEAVDDASEGDGTDPGDAGGEAGRTEAGETEAVEDASAERDAAAGGGPVESGPDAAEATGSGGDNAESDAVGPDGVDPAEPTYAWTDEGAACAACGEPAERRWRDEAGLVCAACKDW